MDVLPSLGFRGDSPVTAGHDLDLGHGHLHLDVELNCAVGNPARYLIAGRLHEIPAGRLFAFWAGNAHALLHPADGGTVLLHWITVPLTWVQDWGFDRRFLGDLLGGSVVVGETDDEADRLGEWIRLIGESGEGRRIAEHEIHARLRRLQRAWLAGDRPRIPADTAAAPVQRMLEAILARYREDLAVADIAAAAGLHPNYAMALFRRTCGHTIHQYLSDLRLAHAQRLLLTTDQAITRIALDAGFPSLSRFYETFQRRWRMTPTAYRRAMGE